MTHLRRIHSGQYAVGLGGGVTKNPIFFANQTWLENCWERETANEERGEEDIPMLWKNN